MISWVLRLFSPPEVGSSVPHTSVTCKHGKINASSLILWSAVLVTLCGQYGAIAETPFRISTRPCKIFQGNHLDCSLQDLIDVPDDVPAYVRHLNLLGNNITGVTQTNMAHLSNLTFLELSRNSITYIEPMSFLRFQRLEYLGLLRTAYAFTGGFKVSPDTFFGLDNLQNLDLTLAGMTSVSKELFRHTQNLRTLRLSFNFIYELPEDTFHYTRHLEVLDLGGIFITHMPRNTFAQLSELRELYLNCTMLTRLPLEALSPLRSLEMLFIEGPFRMIDFGTKLENLTRLNEVSVNSCFYTKENDLESANCNDTEFSIGAFASVYTKSIILNEVVINSQTIPTVLAGPFSPATTEIYLEQVTGLSIHHLYPDLISGIQTSSIEVLDVSRNDIVGVDPQTFANVTDLHHLNLSSNAFCLLDEHAFKGLQNLEILDLTASHLFSVPNLEPFANGSLKVLNMSYNSLKNPIPAEAFRVVPNLTELNLAFSSLSDLAISNDCLKNLSSIEILNLRGNDLIFIPKIIEESLHTMPLLRKLDLSDNRHSTFMNDYRTTLAPLTFLESVDFSGIYPELWIFSDVHSLKELIMNDNDGQAGMWGASLHTEWMKYNLLFPKLEVLSLSHSAVKFLSKEMFNSMPSLQHVDLTRNFLKVVDRSWFENLNLGLLDISNNLIEEISGPSWNQTSISRLLLKGNKFTTIDENVIGSHFLTGLETLDVSQNHLVCDCELVWFRTWIDTDDFVDLVEYGSYTCTTESGQRINLRDFQPSSLQCSSKFPLLITITCSAAFVVVLVIVFVGVYHRWYIRYGCFLLRTKVKGYQEICDEEEKRKKFHAFVSYNSKDYKWVKDTLVPNIEGGSPPFKLCTDYRHFIPGKSICDNILDSIQNSRKTILVLTPNFVDSEWCYYEFEMAQHKLFEESRDVLILLLLAPIPDDALPRRLRKLLCKKNYIEWPEDELGQQLFWERLRRALQTPTIVNRVRDI